jgi:hypothetical protein
MNASMRPPIDASQQPVLENTLERTNVYCTIKSETKDISNCFLLTCCVCKLSYCFDFWCRKRDSDNICEWVWSDGE